MDMVLIRTILMNRQRQINPFLPAVGFEEPLPMFFPHKKTA